MVLLVYPLPVRRCCALEIKKKPFALDFERQRFLHWRVQGAEKVGGRKESIR